MDEHKPGVSIVIICVQLLWVCSHGLKRCGVKMSFCDHLHYWMLVKPVRTMCCVKFLYGVLSDNWVLPTPKHSSSVGRAAVLETGPLPLQDHKSGTVCRPISDHVGCHTASSGGYWRHFCSDSEATAQCELFLTVPNRNILNYFRSLPKRCHVANWVSQTSNWVMNSKGN